MIQLIVNGDDFGLCPSVNQGIVKAYRDGILTSASIMANGDGFSHACFLHQSVPRLVLGLHISLSHGAPVRPVEEVASLVNRQGRFYSKWNFIRRALRGKLKADELELEMRSQLKAALANGLTISHLDSHHHLHCLPAVGRSVEKIARDFRLPVLRRFDRWNPSASGYAKMMDRISRWGVRSGSLLQGPQPECRFFGTDLMFRRDKKAALDSMIRHMPDGLNELMCHPANADIVTELPKDRLSRFAELQALCDPQIRERLAERNIRLVTSADVKEGLD